MPAGIIFRDLAAVMGEKPDSVVFLSFDPADPRMDKTPMPAADAIAEYGGRTVLKCLPYIHSDGELAGMIYVLDENGPARDGTYLVNRKPGRADWDDRTWRCGDTAWIMDLNRRAASCTIRDITGRHATDIVTIRMEDETVMSGVPIQALFKFKEELEQAMAAAGVT